MSRGPGGYNPIGGLELPIASGHNIVSCVVQDALFLAVILNRQERIDF